MAMEYKMIRVWKTTALKLKEMSKETGIPAVRLLDNIVNIIQVKSEIELRHGEEQKSRINAKYKS